MSAKNLTVWSLRLKRGRVTWTTTQAGSSAEDAYQRYLAAFEIWGVDVFDYEAIEILPANQQMTLAYYHTGKAEK
jgi:hypothetical protein